MGIFQQFPYTNFHEMNLDWILGTLRGIDTKLDEALDLIENKITDLVHEPEIRAEIDRIVEEYLTPEQIDEIVSQVVEKISEEELQPLIEDIERTSEELLNSPYPFPFVPYAYIGNSKKEITNDYTCPVCQGACSDGTYYYVYRSNRNSSGAGMLDKYNMNGQDGGVGNAVIADWTREISQPINLGHANGLFYRADTHKIYAPALKSGTPEVPDTRMYIVDPDTLSIEETKDLGYPLMGIFYNSRLKKWVGFDTTGGSYLLFWDEEFNFIEGFDLAPFPFNGRAGIYADDDFIYILQTGAYGTWTPGEITECRISIWDWNKNYRGDIALHHAEELEALAWTGKAFVMLWYGDYGQGHKCYASYVQLRASNYVAASWYRTHWGQNIEAYRATDSATMWWRLDTDLPSNDPRLLYCATHLELDLAPDWGTAPETIVVQRSYASTNLTSWHTIQRVTTGGYSVQTFRITQSGGHIKMTGWVAKRIDNDGTVTTYSSDNGDTPLFKIMRIRACNYTMNPSYQAFLS